MRHITRCIDETHSLIHPEPFERAAAGLEDEPLAFAAWTWTHVLVLASVTIILWAAVIGGIACLSPYLIALVEP